MKKALHRLSLAALCAGLGVFLGGCPQPDTCPLCETLVHDGLQREYASHFPPQYDGKTLMPLMVAIHGAAGTPQSIRELSGFDEIADREGFVVVYPEGINKQWNDGRGVSLGAYPITTVDDVGFISELVDSFVSRYAIDPARVYVVGESNGGMMVQRLACELTDRFAAVASVIGTIPKPIATTAKPMAPISMLMIDSMADPMVPWEGGDVKIGFIYLGSTLSVRDSIGFWVENNQCVSTPQSVLLPDKDPRDGTRVWREVFGGGMEETEVVLYRILGAGHSWPGGLIPQDGLAPNKVCQDINASEVIWDFFKGKSR